MIVDNLKISRLSATLTRLALPLIPSRRMTFSFASLILVTVALFGLSGCGYNTLQLQDEDIKASWSEVVNQYQRRSDLIPNLVKTVQGYASHEKEVLTQVTEARARVGSIQATPELVNDQAAMDKFIQAQRGMTGALSRLMVVAENYPNIKADASFRDLQAQLEGTENRITVSRNRYIESVRNFNVTVRSFPSNLTAKFAGFKVKSNFTVEDEQAISKAPVVDFNPAPPTPPATIPPTTTPPTTTPQKTPEASNL